MSTSLVGTYEGLRRMTPNGVATRDLTLPTLSRSQICLPLQVSGTPERPRLAVFRSNLHIYAQVIDDTQSHTLCSASTLVKDVAEETGGVGHNKEAAYVVGKHVAKRALDKGITKVCFDRGGYLFHGRVKAVADGAREAGLDF